MHASSTRKEAHKSMATLVSSICTANKDWAACHDSSDVLSAFDCSEIPQISIHDFLGQVQRAAGGQYWPMCVLLVDSLSRAACVPVTFVNVHRLMLTAYCIALKLSRDCTGQLIDVARVGGVSCDDLVEMEKVFLRLMEWRVNVNPAAHEKFWQQRHTVVKAACLANSRRDGPFTIIPGALVPVESRFTLEVTPTNTASSFGDAAAQGPSQGRSRSSSGGYRVPRPPTASRGDGGAPRPRV
eukprot:TRINITY_DN95_c0_g1_i4.p1 TRINITY_DN95_c0_g1~~TRINITY_DN95_c0_g1_i4.p1  ORF type:complete len:241 (+),score=34.80 TRINITY_DN95_c0_g1_i4:83-805(+)